MILTVHVQPNARQTEITNWLDDTTVKIRVAAIAEKGKANEALLRFLADYFETNISSINLIRGGMTKMKQIEIPDSLWFVRRT
ncbi:MAG: hypothetical protein UU48_C0008G0014 [Candidatus Uhrbacteria bacterium GW2011_GWF2_41_16]|jgi:hypothetical protein|uniref:UPF0235 protein UU48_C0008G0014 n=2 Tax=Candidatus Uhriibacteriota TaxID=1752732 RepID=A0A0G0XLY8_9BACT|nr:MAG: hypothetical protein UU35_C0014G0023 [Candidatus Uhrbacteria bacterium GW2011_GWC2_41_11]KKR97805.1 MAG: hypothetical protein UU48_C0008G0014 [Candidatus Uhrbacteria bacterium GW2011_GWF2_41_16]HBP00266.1 DUF167 domain-containing protein [Candidatus Uhrbacteria bacterium]